MNEANSQGKSSDDNGSIPAQKKDSIAAGIFKGLTALIGGVILASACLAVMIIGAFGEPMLANNLMSAGPLFLLVILVILTVVVIARILKRPRKE